MTATNHAMTGAIIGLTIQMPAAALVLALLSHYALDVLPHFGRDAEEALVFKSAGFRNYLLAEAFVCFVLVCILTLKQPVHWQIGALCAFLAAAPDLISIRRWLTIKADKKFRPNVYERFATGIQWFEKPVGAAVELVWALGCVLILAKLV
jgi:hypothetical protein